MAFQAAFFTLNRLATSGSFF